MIVGRRPVRRGKNDRALTRYKSHYGVNLLDPSPPTDLQPPGTVLGYGLWATSHANSDKVPPSRSFSFAALRVSSSLLYRYTLCCSCPLRPSLSIARHCQPLSFSVSGFIRKPTPPSSPNLPGAPQPPRTRAREYLSPGHLRAD